MRFASSRLVVGWMFGWMAASGEEDGGVPWGCRVTVTSQQPLYKIFPSAVKNTDAKKLLGQDEEKERPT